ncbi:MAG TPA: nitrate reductase, partial [Acinetobacter sp.]|nr:nitrate reductase [Acinetobacter sp.]
MNYNANYSPKLSNEDLVPAKQNWTWYNIFSFWMSDVHSMGGYVVAASLFSLGLANWQVLLALLIGIMIVQIAANLVAKPSQISGVPYAVISRQAFGIYGANIPALIRGLIAVSWYGIQTWLASNALMMVLLKFYPSLHPFALTEFAGLSTIGWICFAFMWILQALVFWKGMETIKVFIDWAGPMVYVVMLALALWLVWKAGWHNISFNLSDKQLTLNQQIMQTIVAIALVVSYFSGPLLN